MSPQLTRTVRERAKRRCEYCHFPDRVAETPFQVDHIIAEKHRGPTEPDNLAWTCFYCNNYKGPNVAGVDPITNAVTRLFHPRQDKWDEHFRFESAKLVGLTAIGRTTIEVLRINRPDAVEVRLLLSEEGAP